MSLVFFYIFLVVLYIKLSVHSAYIQFSCFSVIANYTVLLYILGIILLIRQFIGLKCLVKLFGLIRYYFSLLTLTL